MAADAARQDQRLDALRIPKAARTLRPSSQPQDAAGKWPATSLSSKPDDHRIITYKTGDKMTVQKDGKAVDWPVFATRINLSVDSTMDDVEFYCDRSDLSPLRNRRERGEAARTWDPAESRHEQRQARRRNKRSGDDDERPTLPAQGR